MLLFEIILYLITTKTYIIGVNNDSICHSIELSYMKKQELAGLSTQEREIISSFTANEQVTIGPDDVIAIHPCPRGTANQILSRMARKGWLQRLKHGVYAVVPLSSSIPKPVVEDAWPLAMDIFRPAFISGWSAAEHWDLTEQIFNSVSVVTMAYQRKAIHVVGSIRFRTRTLPEERFFGKKAVWFGSKAVEIADPSRMVLDILDLPRFGGGGRHTIDVIRQYWHSEMCNPDLLFDYAMRYKRGSVLKRLGFLAEEFNAPVSEEWIQSCRKNLSKGISSLDPDGPATGKIVSKWNLRINLPL